MPGSLIIAAVFIKRKVSCFIRVCIARFGMLEVQTKENVKLPKWKLSKQIAYLRNKQA